MCPSTVVVTNPKNWGSGLDLGEQAPPSSGLPSFPPTPPDRLGRHSCFIPFSGSSCPATTLQSHTNRRRPSRHPRPTASCNLGGFRLCDCRSLPFLQQALRPQQHNSHCNRLNWQPTNRCSQKKQTSPPTSPAFSTTFPSACDANNQSKQERPRRLFSPRSHLRPVAQVLSWPLSQYSKRRRRRQGLFSCVVRGSSCCRVMRHPHPPSP